MDRLIFNLENKGYLVSVFDTKEEAAKYLNGQIDGRVVGFGGSVTLHELNLLDMVVVLQKLRWNKLIEK